MTIRQFIFVALLCSFETYFFNDAILSGNYIFAIFWGFLLYRDLRRAHTINKLTKTIVDSLKDPNSKKKD